MSTCAEEESRPAAGQSAEEEPGWARSARHPQPQTGKDFVLKALGSPGCELGRGWHYLMYTFLVLLR